MFASGKTAAVSGGAPDDKFNYVTMLLHGDGTNGAQNNTFLDSSTNNFTITRNGNTTQGSFSPYGTGWSNYFDGTGDYLTSSCGNIGTGDFTIEGWFYFGTTPSTMGLFQASSTSGGFAPNQTANLAVATASSSTWQVYAKNTYTTSSSTSVPVNTWAHMALVRNGTTTVLYINGSVVITLTSDSTNYSTSYIGLGGIYDNSSYLLNGYLSNFRVVVGRAVYTAAFTPPTSPLGVTSGGDNPPTGTQTSLLTCQSNRFLDSSNNGYAITKAGDVSVQRFNPFGASTAYSTSVIGGSGYFDGSGDYLTIGNPSVNSAVDFGAGNFTIEAWVCPNSTGPMLVVGSLDNSSGKGSWWFVINGTFSGGGTIQFAYNITAGGTGINVLRGTGTLSVGAWSHVAVTRDGSNIRAYLNGVQLGSTYTGIGSDTIYPVNQNVLVGETVAGDSYAMNGYMSDMRIIKGTALYTGSTYTIPTAPLTAITNTSRLLNFTNGAIFDNAMMNDLETVGNAQISTSVKKYGTGSLAFDGTGDWMLGVNGQTINFGSGDFTVEFWINPTNWSNTYVGVIGCSTTNGLWIGKNASNFVLRSSNTADLVSYGTMPTTGTWTHIAITRSGTTARMFYDGTQVASGTTSNNFVEGPFYIGQDSGGNAFTGYIDDLRITKGYARYTSNFTAPTAAFPNTGPI